MFHSVIPHSLSDKHQEDLATLSKFFLTAILRLREEVILVHAFT